MFPGGPHCISFAVLLFKNANFQLSQVRTKRLADKRGPVLLRFARRTVRSLQEFPIQHNLYRFHAVDFTPQKDPHLPGRKVGCRDRERQVGISPVNFVWRVIHPDQLFMAIKRLP